MAAFASPMMHNWLNTLSVAEAPAESIPKASIPRSPLDCFVSQPAQDVMDKITPQLLTSQGGTFDILFSIPDPVTYPLSQDDVSSAAPIKKKYLHTLNICDLLWIEEIKIEMDLRSEKPAHGRSNRSMWVGQWALVRIRLLLKRAFMGLSYIETLSREHNLSVDFPDLRAQRLEFYPDSHPRIVLKHYIIDPNLMHPASEDYMNISLEEMTLGFDGAW